MKTYGKIEYGYYSCDCSYDDLIEEFSEIVESVRIGDYGGDLHFFIKDERGRYGWLTTGYGSCGGCDVLMACESDEDVIALRDSLYNDTEWFESLEDLKVRLSSKDWGAEWYYHEDLAATKRFVDKVLSYEA